MMRGALSLIVLAAACGPTRAETPSTPPAASGAAPTEGATSETSEAEASSAVASCETADACMAEAEALDAEDPGKAAEIYFKACRQGSVQGCELAGLRWSKFVEATADDPLNNLIIDAFRRSCELGGGEHGCGNVGLAYFYGIRGLPVDVDKAVEYMTRACEVDGNRLVCRRLEQYEAGTAKPGVLPQ